MIDTYYLYKITYGEGIVGEQKQVDYVAVSADLSDTDSYKRILDYFDNMNENASPRFYTLCSIECIPECVNVLIEDDIDSGDG